jgi:hypothetical protein
MSERELEHNDDGVVIVACPCGRKVARHIDQTPPLSATCWRVPCVCGGFLHVFACKNRKTVYELRRITGGDPHDGWVKSEPESPPGATGVPMPDES